MTATTAGRYRVLPGPDEDRWLFVAVDDVSATGESGGEYAPTYVPRSGHGDLDDAVADLHPGYLVEATVEWNGERPQVTELSVVRRTLFEFVDGATNLFEAAQSTWAEAAATNEPMNSRVTYDTDGRANGVLYVFAQQPGAQDLFEEFQSGVRPLEPLLEKVDEGTGGGTSRETDRGDVALGPGGNLVIGETEDDDPGGDPPREVFVMRPANEPYVLVYVVLRRGSLLADTMRDTYHCPRPPDA